MPAFWQVPSCVKSRNQAVSALANVRDPERCGRQWVALMQRGVLDHELRQLCLWLRHGVRHDATQEVSRGLLLFPLAFVPRFRVRPPETKEKVLRGEICGILCET
jgi:hypothetical protein